LFQAQIFSLQHPFPFILHQSAQQQALLLLTPGTFGIRNFTAFSLSTSMITLRSTLLPHSKDVYDQIPEMHEETNVGCLTFTAFLKLLALKWNGTDNLEAQTGKFAMLNAKLTALKQPISNLFLAYIFPHSLPESTNWIFSNPPLLTHLQTELFLHLHMLQATHLVKSHTSMEAQR
jgi:hypothetical protein